jgi:hypothetical protein
MSGGDPIMGLSGWPWSGTGSFALGGIQLKADKNNSGNIYVGTSGGITNRSGGFLASGMSGLLDGMQLGPGDALFVPATLCGRTSGNLNIFAVADSACSGQARLYWWPELIG